MSLELSFEYTAIVIGIGGALASLAAAVISLLKLKRQTPRVIRLEELIEVTNADGSHTYKVVSSKLVEPGPSLQAELNLRLEKRKDIILKFNPSEPSDETEWGSTTIRSS